MIKKGLNSFKRASPPKVEIGLTIKRKALLAYQKQNGTEKSLQNESLNTEQFQELDGFNLEDLLASEDEAA